MKSVQILLGAFMILFAAIQNSSADDNRSPAETILAEDDAIFVGGTPRISTSLHRVRDAAKAGYDYVAIPVYASSESPPREAGPLVKPIWLGRNSYDWQAFDERISQVWGFAPSMKVILYLNLTPPVSWLEENPDELIRYEDESQIQSKPGVGAKGGLRDSSLASQVYIEDASRFLKSLIQHIDRQPYRDKIAGIHLVGGHDGQWMWRGAGQGGFSADYGPAMKKYFADFLRRRYGNDVQKLRAAWNRPGIDFDTAGIPSTQRRNGKGSFSLRNPKTDQDIIDYTEAYGNAPVELILKLAETVKKASGNRLAVGVYAGSTVLNVDTNTQAYGRIFQYPLLQSPFIDFIAAPTYGPRRLGHPGAIGLVHSSLQLHGKLGINEYDVRTWLSKIKSDRENFLYGYTPDWERQRAVFLKMFVRDITSGVGSWQYDMHHGWFDALEIWSLFHQVRSIRKEASAKNRKSVAEVAIVVDDKSQIYLPRNDHMLNLNAVGSQRTPIGWTGAPYDLYFLNDILDERVRGYKCYVFLNTLQIDDAARQRIHEILRKNNATAVWVYAAGIVANGVLSTDNIEKLTGIAVKETSAPFPDVILRNAPHPLLNGIEGHGSGIKEEIIVPKGGKLPPSYLGNRAPAFSGRKFFSPTDKGGTEILGYLRETELPGIAVRKMAGWTSIYSSAPVLSAELWRNIFQYAGVFRYSRDLNTAVTANNSYISVYARTPGKRLLFLPQPARLREVFTNQILDKASEFELEMKQDEVRLFVNESGLTE